MRTVSYFFVLLSRIVHESFVSRSLSVYSSYFPIIFQMPPRRSPRTRENDLSLSGLDPLPANTSSNDERASKKFKSSGTNKTETEAAGDIEDSIQLMQLPETILKQLDDEKKAKEKKMEEIEKKIDIVKEELKANTQQMEETRQSKAKVHSQKMTAIFAIGKLKVSRDAIMFSLINDTLSSSEKRAKEAEQVQVETRLILANEVVAYSETQMADLVATKRSLDNDRDRYEREHEDLQSQCEKLREECDLLTAQIKTLSKDHVATRVDTSSNSSPSAQDAADAKEEKKVRVSCP